MNVKITSPKYEIVGTKDYIEIKISPRQVLSALEARSLADALIEAADINEGKEWDHLYGRPCPHCGNTDPRKAG
jgi:hypothetical protein